MNRFKLAYIILGIGMAAAIIVAVSVTLVDQRGGGDNNSSTTNTQGDNVETAPSAAPSELTLTGSEPATTAPSPVPSFLRATAAPTTSSGVTSSPTVGDNGSTTISPAPSPSTTASPTAQASAPTLPSDTASPSSSAPGTLSPTAGTSAPPVTATPTAAAPSTTSPPSASPTTAPPVTTAPSSSPPTTLAPSTSPPTTLAPTSPAPLIAPSSGSFKILQLSDLHLGESIHNDRSTWLMLDVVLNEESPIDLIVLTGDIASNNVSDASSMYQELGNFLSTYNTPWAVLFGEADDAPGPNGTTTRQQLVQVTQQFDLSLTQSGPSDVFGTSNYVLNVWNSQQSSVAAQVVLLDTGGGSLPQQLTESQATWFTTQRASSSAAPAFVFQHIPTNSQFEFDESRCSGLNGDGGISPLQGGDGDMFSTLSADGNVWFIAVGHNHGNDYCCSLDTDDMHICFGRHSGYGGYSSVFGRGGRVYEVQFENDVATSWQSHVRLEFGFVVDPYDPNSS